MSIGKVSILVSVGIAGYGSGCVFSVIEGSQRVQDDARECGDDIVSFFISCNIPEDPGVYIFTGEAHESEDDTGDLIYLGDFSKCRIDYINQIG